MVTNKGDGLTVLRSRAQINKHTSCHAVSCFAGIVRIPDFQVMVHRVVAHLVDLLDLQIATGRDPRCSFMSGNLCKNYPKTILFRSIEKIHEMGSSSTIWAYVETSGAICLRILSKPHLTRKQYYNKSELNPRSKVPKRTQFTSAEST